MQIQIHRTEEFKYMIFGVEYDALNVRVNDVGININLGHENIPGVGQTISLRCKSVRATNNRVIIQR